MTDSEKLDLIIQKIGGLDERVSNLEVDLKDVKQKVTKVDLIIENEIRVSIKRMIERYLDLSRKLNECIRLASDIKDKQEIQDIYINMHDGKLEAL